MFTDSGQDDLFRCFFISIFAQLAAGHGEMTAAAQGFHDDLYIDRAVGAGRETESIVCVIEKETGPDLLHGHKVVRDLSGEYLGVFCPFRALGNRDIVIDELHMGQDLGLGLDEVDVLRKESVDELRICSAAAQEARCVEGTDAGLDGEVLRIDDDSGIEAGCLELIHFFIPAIVLDELGHKLGGGGSGWLHVGQKRLSDDGGRTAVVVDNDFLRGFFEDFRGGDELRDVRVSDDDDGLIRHESLCLALVDEEPFGGAALLDGIDHLAAGVTLLREDDMCLDMGGAREVGDADRRTQGIEVFMIVSHDEHHIRVFDDLLQRLRDDADAHTGGGDGCRRFPAEGLHFLSEADDGLIAAASKGEVKGDLCLFELLHEGVTALYDADGECDRDAVHRMDRADGIEDLEIALHHFCQCFMRNAGNEVARGVLLDEAFLRIEEREDFLCDVGEERGALDVGHICSDFGDVIDTDEAEDGPCFIALFHGFFDIGAIHEVEDHEVRIVLLSGVQKFVENAEEGLARMALEPPGFAPDLGDLLPGDEILKTDSDLGSLAEPAAEDIVRPDQLFLLIHHRDADREVLHRIHRTGRNARGQIIQIAQELLLLPVVRALHVDDDSGHDDKEEQPQRPILRGKQQRREEQQADHEL